MMKQKELVPKKRFEGFADSWKELSLEDVIHGVYNGQTPSRFNGRYWNGNINWLSSGELNKGVVIDTNERITEEGRQAANLRIVPKDTFVMAITGLEAAGTRGNCAILGIDTTLNQSCMAIYPNHNLLDAQYLFQWYMKIGESYGLKYTQGTKQQSYNAVLVNKLKITLPNKKEQQKIGQFFKHLDEMIALQQKKIDKTKALKSAYLAEMFPAEGERVPRRRFEGFTETWEQEKLGNMGTIQSGIGFPENEQGGKKGVPFIKVSDMNLPGNELELIRANHHVNQEQINQKGWHPIANIPAIVFAKVGAAIFLNRKRLIKTSFLIDNNMMSYSFNSSWDVNFGKILFEKLNLAKYAQVGALPSFNASDIDDIRVNVPTVEEQNKIGEFFKNLDNIIINHQQKLEKLKETKQAYLNEMFV